MNEPREPRKESAISWREGRALVLRARALAPFRGQEVDRLGSFVTHFSHQEGEGFTSIYIPGPNPKPGMLYSDMVQIIRREPEYLPGNATLICMTCYIVHEADFSADYLEDIRLFDTATGQREELTEEDKDALMQAYAMERKFQVTTFTKERLREANELLDSLDPNDTFELPDPSNE